MTTVSEEELTQAAVAPRVTQQFIEGHIKHIAYFTAHQGAIRSLNDTAADDGTDPSEARGEVPEELRLLTICVLTLSNGFTVLGESACASPENFSKEFGQKIAYGKAFDQCYMLYGFQLRQQLHDTKEPVELTEGKTIVSQALEDAAERQNFTVSHEDPKSAYHANPFGKDI